MHHFLMDNENSVQEFEADNVEYMNNITFNPTTTSHTNPFYTNDNNNETNKRIKNSNNNHNNDYVTLNNNAISDGGSGGNDNVNVNDYNSDGHYYTLNSDQGGDKVVGVSNGKKGLDFENDVGGGGEYVKLGNNINDNVNNVNVNEQYLSLGASGGSGEYVELGKTSDNMNVNVNNVNNDDEYMTLGSYVNEDEGGIGDNDDDNEYLSLGNQ
eukprot:Pgem_evm1s17620